MNKQVKQQNQIQTKQMSVSVIENSFQVIPFQQPSTEHKGVHLHESIIKSFSLNQSQVHKNKHNNNSVPVISTDMLNTFNPEAFYAPYKQNPCFGQIAFERITSPVTRPLSQNSKVKVNFSYGFGHQNSKIISQNSFPLGLNRSVVGFGMNLISRRSNNFFTDQTNSGSLQNNRPFSSLSQLSKSKKPYLETSSVHRNGLIQFMSNKPIEENNEGIKTHKLGKKFKNVKFSHNNSERSQHLEKIIKMAPIHQYVQSVESPHRNNISMLSMQRSEYVLLPQSSEKIHISPSTYVYSQNVIMSRPIEVEQTLNNRLGLTNRSRISPLDEKEHSPLINIRQTQEHYVPNRKSPKKIDNKVYLQEGEGLMTLEGKGSRLTELENINKLSRITVKGHTQHEIFLQPNDILSKKDLNEFFNKENSLHPDPSIPILQKNLEHPQPLMSTNHDVFQKEFLLSKISELEQRLQQKEQENANLLNRLQNQKIVEKLNSEYDKLELMSRLNEIEIKKLRNEIKIFQIREKVHLNSERQKLQQISQLKTELKALRKGHFAQLAQPSVHHRDK